MAAAGAGLRGRVAPAPAAGTRRERVPGLVGGRRRRGRGSLPRGSGARPGGRRSTRKSAAAFDVRRAVAASRGSTRGSRDPLHAGRGPLCRTGRPAGRSRSRRVLTLFAWDRGDLERARSMAERCLELFSAVGDVAMSAGALSMLAGLARDRGELDTAQEHYEQSLSDFTAARDPQGAAHVLRSMANLAFDQGDHERALLLGEESLRRYERLGNPRGILESIRAMADAFYLGGDLAQADRLADEAVTRFRDRGFAGDLVSALQTAARIALARDDVDRASAMAEEALGPYRVEGHTRDAGPVLCLLARIRAVRAMQSIRCNLPTRAVRCSNRPAIDAGWLTRWRLEQRRFLSAVTRLLPRKHLCRRAQRYGPLVRAYRRSPRPSTSPSWGRCAPRSRPRATRRLRRGIPTSSTYARSELSWIRKPVAAEAQMPQLDVDH